MVEGERKRWRAGWVQSRPTKRGGWLGFDPRGELRQGLDWIWPDVKIELWGRLLVVFLGCGL